MKRFLIVILLIAAGYYGYRLYKNRPDPSFVSVSDQGFSLNGQKFYPMVINYVLSPEMEGSSLWFAPHSGYYTYKHPRKDSSLAQLKADMSLIKDLGFNAVRFATIWEQKRDYKPGEGSIKVRMAGPKDTVVELLKNENYNKHFDALDELLAIVDQAGLKAILLTPVSPDQDGTEELFRRLLYRFGKNKTIMAYDLFNEPQYFDLKAERSKEEVCAIIERYNSIAKKWAKNQLITVGLTGVLEVFEWDPNVLDIDFISLHPYEYEPEQVRNEIYWYGTYIKKPWIIGETAIPADNDSITYETQKQFALKTLEQARNCGASGYSWWQFKDVSWGTYHANYMGLLNQKGEVKPVAKAIGSFDPWGAKGECKCMENYHNYSDFNKFRLTGRLLNEDGEPIEGGIVIAWNYGWSQSHSTFTKKDGSFELSSNFTLYHWMASATMHSVIRDDVKLHRIKKNAQGTEVVSLDTLTVKEL